MGTGLIRGLGCLLGCSLPVMFYAGGIFFQEPRWQWARRGGPSFCWARWQFSGGEKVCFSEALWKTWVLGEAKGDWELQRLPGGRWKARLVYQPEGLKGLRWFFWKGERFREQLSEAFRKPGYSPLFKALVLQEGSQDPGLQFLRKLGFVHLASLSGLHLQVLWKGIHHLCGRWGAFWGGRVRSFHVLSHLLAWAGSAGLWILTGGRWGVLRPWLIGLLKQQAEQAGWVWKKGVPLGLVFLGELLWEAWYTRQGYSLHVFSGRPVYFLAIGGSTLWGGCFPSSAGGRHLGLALSSWIGVALWEAWEGWTVALATPLLNGLSLPLMVGWVYPWVLGGIGLALFDLWQGVDLCFRIAQAPLSTGLFVLAQGALSMGSLWSVPPGALLAGLGSAGLLSFVQPSLFFFKRPWRITGGCLLCLWGVGVWRQEAPPPMRFQFPQGFRVEQWEVGQGDAAWIEAWEGGKRVWGGFYDVGPGRGWGMAEWMKALIQRHIRWVSVVALSHLDEDHRGGLSWLEALVPIRQVTFPEALKNTPQAQALQTTSLPVVSWDDSFLPFPHIQTAHPGRNETMGVIWVPLEGGGWYAAAGDLSARQEEQFAGPWIQEQEKNFPSQGPRLWKISHHGSDTSTSTALLLRIKPTEAWISVGAWNRYGHPTERVLERLARLKIRVRRTDQEHTLSSSHASAPWLLFKPSTRF